MNVFIETLLLVEEKWGEFREALGTHLMLSFIAISVSILISLPLGIYLSKRNRISMVVLNVLYLGKIIPSLGILAILLPYVGIGVVPTLIALAIFAIPTILINTVIAFKQVDRSIIEAARGMGMDSYRILWKIEIPLALPVVIAGIRTAVVEVIAGTTLAAFIGGGGLGVFVINGISTRETPLLLVGAISISILAFAGDLFFGGFEKLTRKKIGF